MNGSPSLYIRDGLTAVLPEAYSLRQRAHRESSEAHVRVMNDKQHASRLYVLSIVDPLQVPGLRLTFCSLPHIHGVSGAVLPLCLDARIISAVSFGHDLDAVSIPKSVPTLSTESTQASSENLY